MPEELFRNQWILRFDVILQHVWPIEQCLLHIRVFFGGKMKRPCFDLYIYWLIKQITSISKIQLVVYYQCCVLIGSATTRLYV